jgi:hypothetical protein
LTVLALWYENRRPVADTKKRAHDLIDRLSPTQLAAAVDLLETMLDPTVRPAANASASPAANAPVGDEAKIECDAVKLQQSKTWFTRSGGEIVSREQSFPHSPRTSS